MADSDKSLKIAIDLATSGTDQAAAAKDAVKGVADESLRYQQVLEQMANKDATASQDKRWAEITAQAQAYVPVAKAAAEAEKVRAEAAKKLEEQLKELGHQQHETGEKTGEAGGHSRAQHLLMSELNKVVPELGHALHAAFSGPIGPLIIMTGAIAEAYSAIKELNKSLDEAAERASTVDFGANIVEKLHVFASAAADAVAFADALDNIATNSETLNTKLQEQLKLMEAIERATAAQTSAEKGLEIAQLQQDEAAHRITPQQAAARRADIEKKYLDIAEKDHQASQEKQLEAKLQTLNKAHEQQEALETQANAAADKVAAEKAHEAQVKIDPVATLDKLNKAIAQLGQLERLENKGYNNLTYEERGEYSALSGMGGLDTRQANVNRLKQQLAEYNATQTPEAFATAQKDADAAAEAKKKATENQTEIINLTKEISALRETIAATRPIEEATTTTKMRTVDTQEHTRIIGDFEKDFHTLEELKKSKNPTNELLLRAFAAISDLMEMQRTNNDLLRTLPEYQSALADMKRDNTTINAAIAAGRLTLGSG